MNISHKCYLILFCSLFFYACSSTSNPIHTDMCTQANLGALTLQDIATSNREQYSYLYYCTVAVMIHDPDKVRVDKVSKDTIIKNRLALADDLFDKGIDIHYKNPNDETLLMSVVRAYLPEEWKLSAAKKLIEQGVDVNYVNKHGGTALSYAEWRKDAKLVEYLSDAVANKNTKPKP